MKKVLILIAFVLIPMIVHAETIKLKSGKTIEGKIVERNDKFIKVDRGIGVGIPYYLDEIESVGEKTAISIDASGINEQPQGKLEEILEKYSKMKEFTCKFTFYKKDEKGPKIGPPVGPNESFDPSKIGELAVTPETTQSGVLKFRKPLSLSYHYNVKSNLDYESKEGAFVISDGNDLWSYDMPTRSSPESKPEKYVLTQKVKDILSLRADMLKSAEKFKEREKRFQDPANPPLVVPPEMENYELINPPVYLPACVLEPFKNLKHDLITFEGEETINGEKVYKFVVKGSQENRKSIHWIGVQDGMPRRIYEYDWENDLVANKMDLADVQVGPNLPEEEFKFKNDGTFIEESLSESMPDMNKMLKQAFDTPPEETFTKFFENPLSEITELKGSGMFFRGGEAFIRFRCSKNVILKDAQDYTEYPQEIAESADYFIKSFPEDEGMLKNVNELTLKKYIIKSQPGKYPEEGRILLKNKKHNVYFFKMWIWVD